MSAKIYNYETCYDLAKQCTYVTEFKRNFGSAYNVARKNNWIKDYTWFVRKQHKPYTYDEVYEIAKNYTCSSDFQKGNGSAYGNARKNGWIKDYYWFVVKQHSPYTYEECFEIAKEYKTRRELSKGNVGAYGAALNHGWLDDYTWFESPQKPCNYWTKERCAEESKKYKNRGEFAVKCGSAYGKARKNGWLDEFTWLNDDRINFTNDKIDCVYAYEFIDLNAVYVGRTLSRRTNERDKEHIFTDKDSVFIFAKQNNVPVPQMHILEDNLTVYEGKAKEGYYVEKYRDDGWYILNRAKTGSLGLLFRNKWTKRTCYDEALKYKTKGDFAKFSGGAYDRARREGWLDDYTWFVELQKPDGYWEVYDNCYNAAKECTTKSEFCHKYSTAYTQSRKNGWIDDYTWFLSEYDARSMKSRKWYYDNTLEEAKKYSSRKEFSKKSRGAYRMAIKEGWIESYDWFENTSYLISKALKNKRRKWTFEKCKELAEESNGRLDFRKKSSGAYNAAWENDWLDLLFTAKKKK